MRQRGGAAGMGSHGSTRQPGAGASRRGHRVAVTVSAVMSASLVSAPSLCDRRSRRRYRRPASLPSECALRGGDPVGRPLWPTESDAYVGEERLHAGPHVRLSHRRVARSSAAPQASRTSLSRWWQMTSHKNVVNEPSIDPELLSQHTLRDEAARLI